MHNNGETEEATKLFNLRIAPLCHLVSQAPDLAIGFHKQILKKRGLIDSAEVRQPAAKPDTHTQKNIDALLERVMARAGESPALAIIGSLEEKVTRHPPKSNSRPTLCAAACS